YSQALELDEQILAIMEHLYPAHQHPRGHSQIAGLLHHIASIYWEMRDLERAVEYYGRAVEMRKRLYPPSRFPTGCAELVDSLMNLGLVYKEKDENSKALDCLRQSLSINERYHKRFPKGQLIFAVNLSSLGETLEQLGEYSQALGYNLRALEL